VTEKVVGFWASVKGAHWHAVWVKGRMTWNTKGLDEYGESHPEVLAFRVQVSPGVAFRRIKPQPDGSEEDEGEDE
jgi:hypothetical protein